MGYKIAQCPTKWTMYEKKSTMNDKCLSFHIETYMYHSYNSHYCTSIKLLLVVKSLF